MKNIKKILTLVILLFSFLVINVKAEDLTEAQINEKVTQILANIPDEITLEDMKEIDAIDEGGSLVTLNNSVQSKLNSILTGSKAMPQDFSISAKLDAEFYDIHKFVVEVSYKKVNDSETPKKSTKKIKITYKNTSAYNEEDKKYVENLVNSKVIKPYTVLVFDESGTGNGMGVLKSENEFVYEEIGKEITYRGTDIGNGDINFGAGWGEHLAFFFKNDVLYKTVRTMNYYLHGIIINEKIENSETAHINYAKPLIEKWLMEANCQSEYGNLVSIEKINSVADIKEGYESLKNVKINYLYKLKFEKWEVPFVIKSANTIELTENVIIETDSKINVTSQTLKEDTPIFKEMQNYLSKKGYNQVFKAFDFTTTDTIDGKIKIKFDVGSENNGKKAIVLHKKHDGTFEELETVVKDGIAYIEVTELSPFMVALKNNNAGTGTLDIFLYMGIIVISTISVLLILKKKEIK